MVRPLAIDLFCGLGGWSDGLLETGYDVVGFDIEQHVYGPEHYPAQLIIQDVLTLNGAQFKDAALIVASPPCQEYSYMAMPWTRAKAKAAAIRADATGAELERLNRLFNTCFSIQREASEAAGRHIPMVVENVRGAQPWVGRARWNFGSYYLWGDVPVFMPKATAKKVTGFRFDGSGGSFQTASVEAVKVSGLSDGRFPPGGLAQGYIEARKQGGDWFSDPNSDPRQGGHGSPARKAASAKIAKIPETLARHIARVYLPPK